MKVLIDWSSRMSTCMDELKKAEEALRLINMHWSYGSEAKKHILEAQMSLVDLNNWIDRHDS